MTNSPLAYLASGCSQIAFVVKDIKAAQKFFNGHLGVPGFYLFEDMEILVLNQDMKNLFSRIKQGNF